MGKKYGNFKPSGTIREESSHMDPSWSAWKKKRKEDHEKTKGTSLPSLITDTSAQISPLFQVKKKGKEDHKKRKGTTLSSLLTDTLTQSSPSFQEKKKRKKREQKSEESTKVKKIKLIDNSELVENDVSFSEKSNVEQDTTDSNSQRKKKKKMKHKKSKKDRKLEESQINKQLKQPDFEDVEQETLYSGVKEADVALNQPRNSPLKEKELLPKSVIDKAKARELKAYLAKQNMTMKEWKKQRKEEYKKWKKAKEAKKLQKLEMQDSKTSSEDKKETPGNGINYTISIAVSGSILDNAQSPELKTYLAGQIARAAAVFNVNEIVVFNDTGVSCVFEDEDAPLNLKGKRGGCMQLMKILQFLECPQYLRRYFFPLQRDLDYASLLNPLNMPHHLRIDEMSPYREGVTLNKPVRDNKGSFVYIGFRKGAIIDKDLVPNVRVTVKLDDQSRVKKHFSGVAVSPLAPYRQDGIYWGYSVRLADSLGAVFSECPYKEGYDLTIGTSDKGNNVDNCNLRTFKHLLIVFGGVQGLDAGLEADESLKVDDLSGLFHHYLNTCPSQGSRTIRTEEAILITLSILRPKILQCQAST